MTFGVLLAAGEPRLAQEIKDLFRESDDFAVQRTVASSTDLFAEINERDADLVLLHEDLGPAPGLAIVRDLLERRPTLAIVLISRDSSAGMLAAAMEAGARGVVRLPVSFTDVQTRLTSAATWSLRLRSRRADEEDPENATTVGQVVAVAGAKGGSGASTVAAQLALAAVRSPGRRVVLVDLDLQAGDLGPLFGVSAHRDVTDLVDVADELTRRTVSRVLFHHSSGVQILPAPTDGEVADTVTAGVVRRVLGVLRTMFDVVVVDCGTTASPANLGAVEIADRVLVVSTPDLLSLRGAERLAQMWERLQIRKASDCEVVLNRTGRMAAVQPALARRMTQVPLCDITLPARFRSLEAATNTASAHEVSDRRLTGAYLRLAERVGIRPDHDTRPGTWRGRAAQDAGLLQSAQFALTVPALLILVTFVMQALLVGAGGLVAQRSAAAAARGIQLERSDDAVALAARSALPAGYRLAAVEDDGTRVRVRVRVPTLLPGLADRLEISSDAGLVGHR
jgi:pilus assembly protein CpaE